MINSDNNLQPKTMVRLIRRNVNAVDYQDPAELYKDLHLKNEPPDPNVEQ